MRIVLDTNVLVSGLLNPVGPPGRVLDLILAGDLTVLADDRILAEYRLVLPRPKFAFEPDDIADVIAFLERRSERILARPAAIVLPDPKDLPFLEVARSGSAAALVTGNTRHFRAAGGFGVAVETPARFLKRL